VVVRLPSLQVKNFQHNRHILAVFPLYSFRRPSP
jgi:hypothetical protein